jgi:hypothetical protein
MASPAEARPRSLVGRIFGAILSALDAADDTENVPEEGIPHHSGYLRLPNNAGTARWPSPEGTQATKSRGSK